MLLGGLTELYYFQFLHVFDPLFVEPLQFLLQVLYYFVDALRTFVSPFLLLYLSELLFQTLDPLNQIMNELVLFLHALLQRILLLLLFVLMLLLHLFYLHLITHLLLTLLLHLPHHQLLAHSLPALPLR